MTKGSLNIKPAFDGPSTPFRPDSRVVWEVNGQRISAYWDGEDGIVIRSLDEAIAVKPSASNSVIVKIDG